MNTEAVNIHDIENTVVLVPNEDGTKIHAFFFGYSQQQHVSGARVETAAQLAYAFERAGFTKDAKVFVSDLPSGKGYYAVDANGFGTDSWSRIEQTFKLRQL